MKYHMRARATLSSSSSLPPRDGSSLLLRIWPTFFVKVYIEGVPISRKIDLYKHQNYERLVQMLSHMFKTTVHCPPDAEHVHDNYYLLTYEDKEGDWIMVGDVPWDFFLTSVKKLQISRTDM